MFFELVDFPNNANIISETFRNGEKTIDIAGFYSPWLLMLITITQLWARKPFLYAYIIGGFINKCVNTVLKNTIKQPRPSNGKSIMNEPYDGEHVYGMPSFHAQSSFYSIAYLFLTNRSMFLLGIELLIGIASIYQRWKYRRHTVEQLGVGSFIGIVMAYITHFITNRTLVTNTLI
jgi:hypothetical protein